MINISDIYTLLFEWIRDQFKKIVGKRIVYLTSKWNKIKLISAGRQVNIEW